ncbi:MAG: hypothetical protein RBU37_07045 [Myxococcota bacterium]|nr:hypothetical protein [Myxococcota bacterium]
MSGSHLSEQQIQALRQLLVKKGAELASQLADVLAGKKLELFSMPISQGELRKRKIEQRLRQYLSLVNQQRQRLDQAAPEFGHCEQCERPFSFEELWEQPWLQCCPDCAAKNA